MKRHDESTSDRLRRMAASDELSVGRGRAEHIATRALARAVARPRTRMVAATIAGSAFAIVSVTGIGAVADQAVPGDSLYVVDRAYESVGRAIGRSGDRTQETLIEALALAQRGDRDRAFQHVTTELGAISGQSDLVVEASVDEATEASLTDTTVAQPTATSSQATAAAAAAESAESPVSETVPAAVAVAPATSTDDDPFILALQNALRASQLAGDAQDEASVLAATEAVKSVVKLAAGATETGAQAQAAPTLSSTTTTLPPPTTTTTTTARNGTASTTTTTVVNNSSTTTTVPTDSGDTSPGDGDTAGGNSGGSQQGSGNEGESGSGSTQPPIILPIP